MKIKIEEKEYDVQEDKTIIEEFADKIDLNKVIAARYNNSVVSLKNKLNKNGEIVFVTRDQKDGRDIYIRGLLYLMSKSFHDLYPNAHLTVNYQLSSAMFCEIENMEINPDMIRNVKNKMQDLIDKNITIEKVEMTPKEAEEFYSKENSVRGKLQYAINKEKVSLYYCEDYYNYFYGVMPISTGFAKNFDLTTFKNGFLLEYPALGESNIINGNKESLKIISAMNEYNELYKLMKINTVYRLNKKIQEGKLKELILFSEAIHEKKIAEIANQIKNRQNVRMVLIAGPTSSGKTTFAGKLGMALRVQGIKPVTISVDNYFVERENNPKDENGNYDFECIEAIDVDLLNSQLSDLLAGKEVELPTFDFTTGHKNYLGNKLRLHDDEILVLEGIHCLNDKLTTYIPKENKFKVYISDLTVLNIDYYNRISTTDTRLIRRIARDYKFRGYSALHTLKMWNSVNRGERKYIFPYQEQADCMFNSSIIYELAALKDIVIPLLNEIDNSNPEYSEARRLIVLLRYFESIKEIDLIPNNSLLREFIGGSIYE